MTDPNRITRTTDPDTSFIAATQAAKRVSQIRPKVYQIIKERGPITHDQIIVEYRELVMYGLAPHTTDSSIRTRVSELVEKGQVERAGWGDSAFGNAAILWSVKERKPE